MEQFASADLAKIVDDLRRWVVGSCGAAEPGLRMRAAEAAQEAGRDTGGPGP